MKHSIFFDQSLPIEVFKWIPQTYLTPKHWHSCQELGCCISGKGWFYFGDKRYPVEPGDLFVVNNLERHIAQANPDDPSEYIFMNFDITIIDKEAPELLLPFIYYPEKFCNRIPGSSPVAKEIKALMELILEEAQHKNKSYHIVMKSALQRICVILLRHNDQTNPEYDWQQTLNLYNKLKPALSFIDENFREPLELEQVSTHLALSPSRTRHLFKETLGKGFKEYLMQVRINEARWLLTTTDLSITEIYLKSGFQSHTPFYRSFKQLVGLTPQDYRNQTLMIAFFGNEPAEIEKLKM